MTRREQLHSVLTVREVHEEAARTQAMQASAAHRVALARAQARADALECDDVIDDSSMGSLRASLARRHVVAHEVSWLQQRAQEQRLAVDEAMAQWRERDRDRQLAEHLVAAEDLIAAQAILREEQRMNDEQGQQAFIRAGRTS
jgi:hypothetical protein